MSEISCDYGYYTLTPYEGTDGEFILSWNKWCGVSFVEVDLETHEQNHEDEEYYNFELDNNPEDELEYLSENYRGRLVNVHHYRWLVTNYHPEHGVLWDIYESGETYVEQYYICEDGEVIRV